MPNDAHVDTFLKTAFDLPFNSQPISETENRLLMDILTYVRSHITGASRPKKYMLGLALDFTLLSQRLSIVDAQAKKFRPSLNEQKLFQRYNLITERGETTANTLTLKFNETQEGIRKLEERVVELFHSLNRRGYPSAYVYNTGQWHKFKDLLVMCFQLSESGRFSLCLKLIEYGCTFIPEHTFFGRQTERVRLFEIVLEEYPRSATGENGGLAMQAIAHGFVASDRPHLSILVDKVRTGSARQKRFGDIDAYKGLDIELSVEVKDIHINEANYNKELDGFIKNAAAANALAMVFIKSIDEQTKQKILGSGVVILTLADVKRTVNTWDWHKQDNALQVMLHHVAHIEQNTAATTRLLMFIFNYDSDHSSLTYLQNESVSSI